MDKSTSDKLFTSTPSLQRLRQQIVKQTNVGPSSLGEKAGLGLFASKSIKVSSGTIMAIESFVLYDPNYILTVTMI